MSNLTEYPYKSILYHVELGIFYIYFHHIMLSYDQFVHLEPSQKRAYLRDLYLQLNENHTFDDLIMILSSETHVTQERLLEMYTGLLELLEQAKTHMNETSHQHLEAVHSSEAKQHQADQQQAEELLKAY